MGCATGEDFPNAKLQFTHFEIRLAKFTRDFTSIGLFAVKNAALPWIKRQEPKQANVPIQDSNTVQVWTGGERAGLSPAKTEGLGLPGQVFTLGPGKDKCSTQGGSPGLTVPM